MDTDIDFTEIVRPKPAGETVNVHVVSSIEEPRPDYAAMQRLIELGRPKPEKKPE